MTLVLMANSALAAPIFGAGHLDTPGTQRTLALPEAADGAPIISLGSAIDPESGKVVEGYAIFAKGGIPGKPDRPGDGGDSGDDSKYYDFLAKGAKWRTVESWLLNPENNGGLPYGEEDPFNNNVPPSLSFAFTTVDYSIFKWEDAADGAVDSSAHTDILGYGTETYDVLAADLDAPDGKNEVYFADISESGAIGVTIVWGVFGGPPQSRELIEWDQVYDDADYAWSTSGEAGKMDFENIATHELGHSVGLADLYQPEHAEQTMYGYADLGETKKQTLEGGDIAGVSTLY